jgi:hypothetical protein
MKSAGVARSIHKRESEIAIQDTGVASIDADSSLPHKEPPSREGLKRPRVVGLQGLLAFKAERGNSRSRDRVIGVQR